MIFIRVGDARGLLLNEVDSLMNGLRKEIARKHTRYITRYADSAPYFRVRCDAMEGRRYSDFDIKKVTLWNGFLDLVFILKSR